MKFVLGLAAALAFGALNVAATPVMAKGSAMETGSNATDTKGAGMKSGGKMQSKKMRMKKKSM